jgi:hypothetical protein
MSVDTDRDRRAVFAKTISLSYLQSVFISLRQNIFSASVSTITRVGSGSKVHFLEHVQTVVIRYICWHGNTTAICGI